MNEYRLCKNVDFGEFIGKIFHKINVIDDAITFIGNGYSFHMYHQQDCCEYVSIEDITGDIQQLIGNVIVMANESWNDGGDDKWGNTNVWTFYHLADDKGHYVTIRWYGTSNGYYSEHVEIVEITNKGEKQS